MNVFNRIVVVILLLAGLVLWPAFFLFPQQFLSNLTGAISNFEQTLEGLTPTLRLGAGIALAILSFLLCLLLLILELRPSKPGVVRVTKADKGEILLELDSVARRIQQTVAQVPNVVEVKPSVKRSGAGVAVEASIVTTPEVNVPEKSREIMEIVKNLVEGEIGVKLTRLQLRLKHLRAPITVKK
jgi:hypothetical protein